MWSTELKCFSVLECLFSDSSVNEACVPLLKVFIRNPCKLDSSKLRRYVVTFSVTTKNVLKKIEGTL